MADNNNNYAPDRTLYRVLLLEDNPDDARLIREALGEHLAFSFQVAHFPDVDNALKFLERDTVDVALLDHVLSRNDLAGLTSIVAAAPNLPVVVLTDVDDDALGLRVMEHGAQDYLVKGTVDGAALVRTIRQAIARKAMSDRVRDSEERFTLAAAGGDDGIWDWHIPGDHLFLSPRAKAILGLPENAPDENMEVFSRRIHLDDVSRFRDAMALHLKGDAKNFRQQARIMDAGDQPRWLLVRGMAVRDGKQQPRRMAGSITDLSNLDAYYDPVTGLPNRALLLDRVRGTLKIRVDHAHRHSALLLIFLSRYSEISETFGHEAGDALVAGAAQAIERAIRVGDVVGRVSSSEIGVLLDGVANADEAVIMAGRVCHALLAPVAIAGRDIISTTRMGVVVITSAYTDAEIVMRDAAAALSGEQVGYDLPFCVFNLEMRQLANTRLRIESALRHAIEKNAFRLVYQPIVALDGGLLRGFEALLRWQDQELGQVEPAVFVPIAEEIGLIQEIGSWVLRTACQQIVKWRADGLIANRANFTVSVNLSGRQLDAPDSIDHILAIIEETAVPPSNLTLELTETALFINPDHAREALMAIKLHGVSLAMDDFGTGYSSLSYLGRFPFDKLKIDRSFVNTIAAGVASPLLKGMFGLTRELGLCVVAEGVETPEQRDVLATLGCQDAQGWLFGRPLDPHNAETLLRDAPTDVSAEALEEAETANAVNGEQRRSAVVVAAAIVDYSRMMAQDETKTIQTLADVRRIVDAMIVANLGRTIGIAGGSYMLEFNSVVGAVGYAVAVQQAMTMRNAEVPEDRRMEFRIGVNLGDIVVRGFDISGDGFSIAVGLEALAAPGGICVSEKVYDQVAQKLDLGFEDLGLQPVENAELPIRAYRTAAVAPA